MGIRRKVRQNLRGAEPREQEEGLLLGGHSLSAAHQGGWGGDIELTQMKRSRPRVSRPSLELASAAAGQRSKQPASRPVPPGTIHSVGPGPRQAVGAEPDGTPLTEAVM